MFNRSALVAVVRPRVSQPEAEEIFEELMDLIISGRGHVIQRSAERNETLETVWGKDFRECCDTY